MPTCECGLTVSNPRHSGHLNGGPHRAAMSQRYAEKLGLDHPCPPALAMGRYRRRIFELDLYGAVLMEVRGRAGSDPVFKTTGLIAAATWRMGVPAEGPPPSFDEAAMQIALTLYELYGDDATYVWWKVAVLHEDPEARKGVVTALKANGALHSRPHLAAFHRYAYDALLLVEGERVRLRRAELRQAAEAAEPAEVVNP